MKGVAEGADPAAEGGGDGLSARQGLQAYDKLTI